MKIILQKDIFREPPTAEGVTIIGYCALLPYLTLTTSHLMQTFWAIGMEATREVEVWGDFRFLFLLEPYKFEV